MNPNCDIKNELSQYSGGMRKVEVLSLVLFGGLFGILFFRVLNYDGVDIFQFFVSISIGYVGADFVSGVVHWFADTWGTLKWPIIGNSFIRSFREHHVDPLAITRHDFVEANGASAIAALPVLLACLYTSHNGIGNYVFVASLMWLCIFSVATSQFHKWSHQKCPTPAVRFLQNYRIILSPKHHDIHHLDLDRHYCMTTGWLNPILNKVGFFRSLEFLVQKVFSAVPRCEDQIIMNGSRHAKKS